MEIKGLRSKINDCVESLRSVNDKVDDLEKAILKDVKILDKATEIYKIYKDCPSQLMSKGEFKAYSLAQYIVTNYPAI